MQGMSDIREVIAFPKTNLLKIRWTEVQASCRQAIERIAHKIDFVKETPNALFTKIKDVLNKEKIDFEVMEHKPVYTSRNLLKFEAPN